MSAAPPLLELRQAIIARLKADPVVTAIIAAASIYGEHVPDDHPWPFVRYGEDDAIGTESSIPIHVHSKAGYTDECKRILAIIGTNLDSASILLADGRRAALILTGSRILADPDEADAWHGIATIRAKVARPCDQP